MFALPRQVPVGTVTYSLSTVSIDLTRWISFKSAAPKAKNTTSLIELSGREIHRELLHRNGTNLAIGSQSSKYFLYPILKQSDHPALARLGQHIGGSGFR